jgi:hypothetical protein
MENGEWLCGETFAQEVFSTLHSSPVEEKKIVTGVLCTYLFSKAHMIL